ncbi:MAG: hypothetical protein P8O92_09310, partial [Luminiphilus sp.]|nr:hypothetical protein [Luminiphilus sp.]
MKNQPLFLSALLLSLSLTSSIASAQDVTFETKDVEISKVFRDDAIRGTQAWNLVESITTEVGPRLAGSEAEARARDWAVQNLNDFGFENVRVEPFMIEGWRRGEETAA